MKFVANRFGGPIALICVYCGCIFLGEWTEKPVCVHTHPDTGTVCSTDCASMIRLVSPLTKSHCVVDRRLVHGSHPKVIFIFSIVNSYYIGENVFKKLYISL
jgi:hypothetical protein